MKSTTLFLIAAAAVSVGCKPPPSQPATTNEPATTAAPATPEAEAQQIFSGRCSPCHGATGMGDGAAAAALNPHPRNFHDAAWQTATTDDAIENIIRVGGAAVGKSAAMPPNPDLVSKPAVVTALRGIIRGFR